MTDFNQQLVELVKACGQELIERAEDLVGNGDLISDFRIWIRIPVNGMDLIPTIEVSREHCCRHTHTILHKGKVVN